MCGEASLLDVAPIFLQTLQKHKVSLPDNRTTDMARVHMLFPLSLDAMRICKEMQGVYGHGCIPSFEDTIPSSSATVGPDGKANITHTLFMSTNFIMIGFAKYGILLNLLTLGYDTLFMDNDQVIFKNPVPSLYTLYKADLYGAQDTCRRLDTHDGVLAYPDRVTINIGVLFARATGPVTRCFMNWAFTMQDSAGTPVCWDQSKFHAAMTLCMKGLQYNHMSFGFLSSEAFTSLCAGVCGCDAAGLPRIVWRGGRGDKQYADNCPPRVMKKWAAFHVACFAGHADGGKVRHMKRVMEQYEKHVGPIGGLPEDKQPMPWWTSDPWWKNFTHAS
ncbi:hypothetical protein HYH03_018651 [Edaphochlamys debaryana]|uniref:Nucleotide-diphospho-sugar transferase domain-containing protein n=1 Tax=Edaphochlamys debaryana TaxID=47281 RepID=A0A835XEV8_9CHLO|nr:hypothetical protein HYH03_018651 [Edaphochlamys debaryana]|eukprot:KAG2482416.1 hypothetical protein HYH03_018651 [Edaphochlamys debaryana]